MIEARKFVYNEVSYKSFAFKKMVVHFLDKIGYAH